MDGKQAQQTLTVCEALQYLFRHSDKLLQSGDLTTLTLNGVTVKETVPEILPYNLIFVHNSIHIMLINNNPTLYGDLKEPDMVLFYNKDIGTKDVVVVEFKGIGATDDDKLYSYSEINRNNVYVARNLTDVNAIYSYIITSLTDNLISDFNTNDNVVLLHTEHKKPIIYWYNRKPKNANGIEIPCHTFVIDTETIVKDADVRNKAFLDLLMSKK